MKQLAHQADLVVLCAKGNKRNLQGLALAPQRFNPSPEPILISLMQGRITGGDLQALPAIGNGKYPARWQIFLQRVADKEEAEIAVPAQQAQLFGAGLIEVLKITDQIEGTTRTRHTPQILEYLVQ